MSIPTASCSADCSDCPIEAPSRRPAGPYSGGRFAAVSVAYFLGPLATTVGGAILAGPDQTAQFLGGTVGLIGGLAAAVLLARVTAASRSECLAEVSA